LDGSVVFKGHERSAQGGDIMEDDEHNSRPRMVRTELKIQEVAMLVHAKRPQMVDKFSSRD
jgi:hypothetical protein